jgi:hypothetical protein
MPSPKKSAEAAKAAGEGAVEVSKVSDVHRLPWENAEELLVAGEAAACASGTEIELVEQGRRSPGGMDRVVKKLGFEVPWTELQEMLQKPSDPVPPSTGYFGTVTADNPLLERKSGVLGSDDVVSESVLEAVQKQSVHVAGERLVERKPCSLQRYKPYSSPLLSLSSYRLSPNYRTHEKLSLSSLSHSNKIKPTKIWCKFEVFGKCSNPKCRGQHFRNVELSKSELVNDIISYSPTLSTHSTEVSETASETPTTTSRKSGSYGECLIETYSGKMSDDQLLVLAAHRVNEARTGSGERSIVDLEETRAQGQASEAKKARERTTRPPPLYWEGNTPPAYYLQLTATTAEPSGSCSKMDRYFSMTTTPDPPTTRPADPSHFLSLARGTRNLAKSCGVLESGLGLHPTSQELWVEYLEAKSGVVGSPERQATRDELLEKAMTSCPTYSVAVKCIQLAVSVAQKSSWILRGYHTVTSQNQSVDAASLSLCCVELLLSHAYLHCSLGRLEEAVSTLQLSLEAGDKTAVGNSPVFTGTRF